MLHFDVSKNGYEEGLEAGKKVAGKYKDSFTARLENWRGAFEEAPTFVAKTRDPEVIREHFRKVTWEDILAFAGDLHGRKMAALPDLERFPELRGEDEYQTSYAKGFAEGAGIDIRRIYVDRYWHEIFDAVGDGRVPSISG